MIDFTKCAFDPIPADAIRISEAFDKVLDAIIKDQKVLDSLSDDIKDILRKNMEMDEGRDHWKLRSQEAKDAHHRSKAAIVFFRWHLSRGELTAYIRDPEEKDSTILQLDYANWGPFSGRLLVCEPPYGFEEDFLESYPTSNNPNTFIRGYYRPVFFWKKDFDRWFHKVFEVKKHSGGRPPGSGSLHSADQPLLVKMHDLIESGEAHSPNDAARLVAPEARGAGTFEAKQARLRKSYKNKFPVKRN